jgi:hypothetical protein
MRWLPAFAAALLLLAAGPAHADDRPPSPAERAAIEQALRGHGFVRWDDIELDDELWEVDDAVGTDGRDFDVKLDPATLAIVEMDD